MRRVDALARRALAFLPAPFLLADLGRALDFTAAVPALAAARVLVFFAAVFFAAVFFAAVFFAAVFFAAVFFAVVFFAAVSAAAALVRPFFAAAFAPAAFVPADFFAAAVLVFPAAARVFDRAFFELVAVVLLLRFFAVAMCGTIHVQGDEQEPCLVGSEQRS